MAPTRSRVTATERNMGNSLNSHTQLRPVYGQIARRNQRASAFLNHNANQMCLNALTRNAVSTLLQDTRKRHGHVIGTLYVNGLSASVCAIFDLKDTANCTHPEDDDIADEYLRDFKRVVSLPMHTPTAPSADRDATANLFFGHLYPDDYFTPQLIMATLNRNRRGQWIGENIVWVTADMLFRLSNDYSPVIVTQVIEVGHDEARHREVEQRERRLEEREADLLMRETAVQERGRAVSSVKE